MFNLRGTWGSPLQVLQASFGSHPVSQTLDVTVHVGVAHILLHRCGHVFKVFMCFLGSVHVHWATATSSLLPFPQFDSLVYCFGKDDMGTRACHPIGAKTPTASMLWQF